MKKEIRYEEKMIWDANDLEKAGFGRAMVYRCFHDPDFPLIEIGGRKLVMKEDFFKWLGKKTKKIKE